jgi:uncharacterized protein DUF4129
MLLRRTALMVFTSVFLCQFVWAETPVSPTLSLPEYISELDRLEAALSDSDAQANELATIAAGLPDSWQVTTSDGRRFVIPSSSLRTGLQQHTPGSIDAARRCVAVLREQAATYDRVNGDMGAQRARLNGILSRREFRNVHGPTLFERLQRYLVSALLRLLNRIFGSSAVPVISRVLVWVLVGLAVLVMAFMIYRSVRRRTAFESIMPEALPVSAKQWSVWMTEARAAAAQGLWRDAIHLAYWAGISFLEALGMWRPDRARTPREYTRLLPAGSPYHPALTALTRRLEVVWYGYEAADEQAYRQTVSELENLGCR